MFLYLGDLLKMNIFKIFKRNKDIVKLAVPVFLELILSVAMGYINQFMLAGIPIASNAVSQANQISNIFIVSFSVFSTSSLILITQLKGSGNNELLNKVYSLSFWVNFILGVVVSSLVIGLANPLFTMMQVKDNVFPFAVMYQYVSGASIIFLALNQVLSSFLRANKKMTQPMLIAVITNVVDAIGVAITLWAFPDGTLDPIQKMIGVGLSTLISRFVGFILSLIFYVKYVSISLSFKGIRPFPKQLFNRLLTIGLPTAGETLSYNFSQLVLMIIVNLSVSVLMQNLRNYIMTFTSIIYLFASGTATAMQVVEGTLVGEGKKDETERLVKDIGVMARTVSFIMSLLITAIAYFVFKYLMGEAIADPSINTEGFTQDYVGLVAVYCMLIDIVLDQGRATNLVYVKGLETAGDISFPVLTSIITSWALTVGVSALLCIVFKLGIYGAFIGACLDECVRGIIFEIRWKLGKWKDKTLVKNI